MKKPLLLLAALYLTLQQPQCSQIWGWNLYACKLGCAANDRQYIGTLQNRPGLCQGDKITRAYVQTSRSLVGPIDVIAVAASLSEESSHSNVLTKSWAYRLPWKGNCSAARVTQKTNGGPIVTYEPFGCS